MMRKMLKLADFSASYSVAKVSRTEYKEATNLSVFMIINVTII